MKSALIRLPAKRSNEATSRYQQVTLPKIQFARKWTSLNQPPITILLKILLSHELAPSRKLPFLRKRDRFANGKGNPVTKIN
jgi:hypothetical protein